MLLGGNQESKFYNRQTQCMDSVRCTKEGEQWYVQQGLVIMGELMNKTREERETILISYIFSQYTNISCPRFKAPGLMSGAVG